VDWSCYSEELAAACEELQTWRDSIESDRSLFKTSMKEEIELDILEQVDLVRAALSAEEKARTEADTRLEQRCEEVNHTMSVEIESRSTWTAGLREILEAEGDERNRIVAAFNAQRQEVQGFAKDVIGIKKALYEGGASIPNLDLTMPAQEDTKELQEKWEATHEALSKEVAKLSGQVKEAPPLLLELTIQLQALQQGLSTEQGERNIAVDNLARKLELVSTVFNVDSRQGQVENAGQMSSQSAEQHEHQLRMIFDQLDSLANTQLSSLREQLSSCSQQLAFEQAERKSDSEMVWSSMQSLHGHLVQFISQPPATAPPAFSMIPESQKSIGRMPRSRSPSPRMPIHGDEQAAARPRVQLPATQQTLASNNVGPHSVLSRSLPTHDVIFGPGASQSLSYGCPSNIVPARAPGAVSTQLSWTPQDLTSGQNISFARHLLTQG